MHPTRELAASPDEEPLSFADWLGLGRGDLRKGERTRTDLLISAARLLARDPFDQITVSSICRSAGVAHGTFYIYYANRNALAGAVLNAFVDYLQLEMRAAARLAGDPTRNATAAYMRLFEENAGLMKSLVTGIDAFPEARAAFQRLNHEWAATVVRAARRREGQAALSESELMRRAYALGGMVDQYLTALFVSRDPWIAGLSQDREAVLDTFTELWKRGMAP